MSVSRSFTSVALAVAGAIAPLFACTSSTGPGQLEVKLVAGPNPAVGQAVDQVDQIVVDVTKVTAHSASAGWVTIGPVTSPTTVDVLQLQTYVEPLGLVNLPAGKVTQIRLFTAPDGNYVVPSGSTTQEPLVVPSGTETGIKIVGPWDVPACTRLTVTLDFDGKNSIAYHQADGKWILRPVIRPRKADSTAISCPEGEPGQACNVETPCPQGQVCVSGTCTSGAPGATGSPCTVGTQCLTGNCSEGVCSPGLPGAPCQSGGDCVSGNCVEGTCGAGAAVGAGGSCQSNSGCLSGNCSGGVCQPGGQGALCNAPGDCQSTPVQLTCTAGSCQPPP